ncbi:flippase-like domain-containing protein [Candidatus Peregrinibacteria bacterium]|nr:flippase-like domain-containing protein [Candidatus Peregrinibacteria bacterium]
MIKRTFAFLFFLVIGIILFVSVIANTGIDSISQSLEKFSLINFIFLLFLSLVNFALFTLRWDIILHHHHTTKKVPFYRLFLHRMSCFAVSYLTPAAATGGEPVRIFFLQEDGVRTGDAVSSTVIDKVFEFTALTLFIFSGVLVSIIDGSVFSGKTEIMLGVFILMFGGLIFWFYYSTIKKIGFFSSLFRFMRLNKIKRFAKYEDGIIRVENQMTLFYTHHLRKFIFLMAISLATVFFMVLEHYLVALFMGVKLTFFQSFLAATIPGISYIIPVPGALGMLEGSHAAIFGILGVSINVFVFVLILRLRDIIFVLIGLAHASKHGIQMILKSFTNGKTTKNSDL